MFSPVAWFRELFNPANRRKPIRTHVRRPLYVETLEDRAVPTVTAMADTVWVEPAGLSSVTSVLNNDIGSPLHVSQVNGSSVDVGQQITLASGALLTLYSNGTFDIIPAPSSTTDSFGYEASDGSGTSTAYVNIYIVDPTPTQLYATYLTAIADANDAYTSAVTDAISTRDAAIAAGRAAAQDDADALYADYLNAFSTAQSTYNDAVAAAEGGYNDAVDAADAAWSAANDAAMADYDAAMADPQAAYDDAKASLQSDYDAAIAAADADYNDAAPYLADVTAAEAAVADANTTLDAATTTAAATKDAAYAAALTAYNAAYDDADDAYDAAVADADDIYDAAMADAASAYDAVIAPYQSARDDAYAYWQLNLTDPDAESAYEAAEDDLNNAISSASMDRSDAEMTAEYAHDSALSDASNANSMAKSTADMDYSYAQYTADDAYTTTVQAYQSDVDSAEMTLEYVQDALTGALADLATQAAAINAAETALATAQSALDSATTDAAASKDAAYATALTAYNSAYDDAQAAHDAAVADADDAYDSAMADAASAYDSAVAPYQTARDSAYAYWQLHLSDPAAETAYDTAEDDLSNAISTASEDRYTAESAAASTHDATLSDASSALNAAQYMADLNYTDAQAAADDAYTSTLAPYQSDVDGAAMALADAQSNPLTYLAPLMAARDAVYAAGLATYNAGITAAETAYYGAKTLANSNYDEAMEEPNAAWHDAESAAWAIYLAAKEDADATFDDSEEDAWTTYQSGVDTADSALATLETSIQSALAAVLTSLASTWSSAEQTAWTSYDGNMSALPGTPAVSERVLTPPEVTIPTVEEFVIFRRLRCLPIPRDQVVRQPECEVAPLLDWARAVQGAAQDMTLAGFRAGHNWTVPIRGGGTITVWRPDDGVADATGYWCHGYTFGGTTAAGGPFSVEGGPNMQTILDRGYFAIPNEADAQPGDILVWTMGPQPTPEQWAAAAASAAIDGGVAYQALIAATGITHSAVLTQTQVTLTNGRFVLANTLLNTKNGSRAFGNMSLQVICYGDGMPGGFGGYGTNYTIYRAR